MTREIKFRAWEKTDEVMMLSGSIDFWFQACAETGKNPLKVKPNTILMQFTGLKDKNGKEIYEGDILSPIKNTKYAETPKGLLCFVEWSEEDCSFRGLKDNKQDGEYLLTKSIAEKHWEIIGNIYENKELLK